MKYLVLILLFLCSCSVFDQKQNSNVMYEIGKEMSIRYIREIFQVDRLEIQKDSVIFSKIYKRDDLRKRFSKIAKHITPDFELCYYDENGLVTFNGRVLEDTTLIKLSFEKKRK